MCKNRPMASWLRLLCACLLIPWQAFAAGPRGRPMPASPISPLGAALPSGGLMLPAPGLTAPGLPAPEADLHSVALVLETAARAEATPAAAAASASLALPAAHAAGAAGERAREQPHAERAAAEQAAALGEAAAGPSAALPAAFSVFYDAAAIRPAPSVSVGAGAPLRLAAALKPADAHAYARPEGLPETSIDESAALSRLLRQARAGASRELPEEARRVRFLVVPGFSWDLLAHVYLKPNIDILRQRGLDFEFIETDSLGTPDQNAARIADAVARSDKPVVLLTHSKGGLDSIRALELHPELQPKVRKVLMNNTPYFGTPWADWFAGRFFGLVPRMWAFYAVAPLTRLLTLTRLFSTNPFFRSDTVRSMSRAARGSLSRERLPIDPRIEVFAVASRVRKFTLGDLLEWAKVHLAKILPVDNTDGVIVTSDAVPPGARFALLEEFGHVEPVTPYDWRFLLFDSRRQYPGFAEDYTEAVLHWMFPQQSPYRPEPAGPAAEAEYQDVLERLGFEREGELFTASLAEADRTPAQRAVLEAQRGRAAALDSARDLAAGVMGGASGRHDRLYKAADLAARLLAMEPLPAPRALPEGLRGAPRARLLEWAVDETHARLSRHLAALLSDLADTLGTQDVSRFRPWLEEILRPMYADADAGGARHAGRALAASLVRHARVFGLPSLERELEQALEGRGLRLADFVGDRFEVVDRRGETRKFLVRDGDVLGIRRRERSASEIAAGARPGRSPALWWKAWRQGLLGSFLAIWLDPEGPPLQVPGQPVRNALRRGVHAARRWLAGLPYFLRGYSHVGMASVRSADGVSLAWVYDATVDSGGGWIRKGGLLHEFFRPGVHLRFGLSRFDAREVRREFRRQARAGWRAHPFKDSAYPWTSGITEAEHADLARSAEEDPAPTFLARLNSFALRQVRRLRLDGTGYDYGWLGREALAHCSLLFHLAYSLGAQFRILWRPDQWHPITYLLQWLRLPVTAGLDLDRPIHWPASLFIDPKMERHDYAEFAPARPRASRPYQERDPRLTASLPPAQADRKALERTLVYHLEQRRLRREGAVGWKTGLNPASGYYGDIETLLDDAPL